MIPHNTKYPNIGYPVSHGMLSIKGESIYIQIYSQFGKYQVYKGMPHENHVLFEHENWEAVADYLNKETLAQQQEKDLLK